MHNAQLLKNARDLTLQMHKVLIDNEKRLREMVDGPISPSRFLTMLLEDRELSWLRRFSTLIVDIDEMFAQRDGFSEDAVTAHLNAMREWIAVDKTDLEDDFSVKFRAALQQLPEVAAIHGELRTMLTTTE
ncbi:MAG: hypothetical protein KF855_10700 [Acidobacteria bacterium]|nr:hypothetical protein [Acidobacteriota bacterium]